jgi:hypothetical protein
VRGLGGVLRAGIIERMSDAEIERIFRSLDRIEARLLKLEEREAMRRGSDMTKTQLVAIIGVISALTGTATAIITSVI